LAFGDSNNSPLATSREEPRVQALVEAARCGDREAFGGLIALYERVVFRTALAALGTQEDAEDAAQEALVIAWLKLGSFRGEATFRTWLLTIVWRKALDRRRVRRLWRLRTSPARSKEDRDPLEDVEGPSRDPEQLAVSRDLAQRIQRGIIRLSPKLKDTFLLAASGEHTYPEIAQLLHVPLGTVKWRVAEARRLIGQRVRGGKAAGHD
jgi:RNA polymerase sigma-70 factor (ECF subfamily)